MDEIVSTKIIGTQKSKQPNGKHYHRIAMPADCSEFYIRKVYSNGKVEFTPLVFRDAIPQ